METNYPTSKSANGPDRTSSVSSAASATASAAKDLYREAKGTAKKTAADLRDELSNLKNDLDALVSRAPSLSDDELSQAHARMMAQFSSLRYAAKGFASEASRQLNRGMETTSVYVKDRPMQSVAVAVGTGLLIGMLLRRR